MWEEEEAELGRAAAFLGTQKSRPNLVQPPRDHWLKEVPITTLRASLALSFFPNM